MKKRETDPTMTKSHASELRLSADWPHVSILFEDDDVLALNKPAGLLMVPDRWDKTRENLMGLLHAGIKLQRPWVQAHGYSYLANAHRLDAGTSGVVMLARKKTVLVNLAHQFNDRHPKKSYLALVQGVPAEPVMEIDLPLAPCLVRPGLSVVDRKRGKPARTRVQVLETFRGYALVRAEPATGRLHQIRIHLREIGCPLIADYDYGSGFPLLLSKMKPHYKMKSDGERPLMGRPALHAERLELLHPVTGAPLVVEAAMPKDFEVSLKYLRRYAS